MNDKTVVLEALIKTEGLRPLCSIISEYKKAGKYDELSKWLSTITVEDTDTAVLVGCLRYTYGVRDKITSWEEFFNDVEQMLIERREDYKSILRGLYD